MQHVAAAAGGFDYGLAFMAGVLGSGHCLGMCGALVSGYFMKAGPSRTYLPYFIYQIARIFVYTMVGFAAAALDSFWFPVVCLVKFKVSCRCSSVLSSLFLLLAF